jgi:hypothetical protein
MRIEHEFYETPPHYIAALLAEINIFGRVYEPCVGDGAIERALRTMGAVRSVVSNDLDPQRQADSHVDATCSPIPAKIDWVVTNPPFSQELEILQTAREGAPGTAFLARLSFLEPTEDRAYMLEQDPPQRIIVLPRYSFRPNDQGKRATDSVTCCWLVWGPNVQPGISVWGRGRSEAAALIGAL